MEARELGIEGAWVFDLPVMSSVLRQRTSVVFDDVLCGDLSFHPNQLLLADACHGDVRGIHYAVPGQWKLVTAVVGHVDDVIIDLRPTSPTFGQHVKVPLQGETRHRSAVLLGPGVGHGYVCTSPTATLLYALSPAYDSATERTVHPFDARLDVDWIENVGVLNGLTTRDATAPYLDEALERRLLPH